MSKRIVPILSRIARSAFNDPVRGFQLSILMLLLIIIGPPETIYELETEYQRGE